jgi:hypothetical protein
MPNCPKCSFGLVLRQYSRKYKCPGCGRLYPQQEIDTKEFVEFNKKERGREKEEAKKQWRKEYNEKNKENRKQWFKDYYQRNKEKLKDRQKEWSKNNPDKVKEYSKNSKISQAKYRNENRDEYNRKKREYWARRRNPLLEKRKENYNNHKDQILGQQAAYRLNNKVLRQINHQRTQQKVITLRMIENGNINPYRYEFKSILPTF